MSVVEAVLSGALVKVGLGHCWAAGLAKEVCLVLGDSASLAMMRGMELKLVRTWLEPEEDGVL